MSAPIVRAVDTAPGRPWGTDGRVIRSRQTSRFDPGHVTLLVDTPVVLHDDKVGDYRWWEGRSETIRCQLAEAPTCKECGQVLR